MKKFKTHVEELRRTVRAQNIRILITGLFLTVLYGAQYFLRKASFEAAMPIERTLDIVTFALVVLFIASLIARLVAPIVSHMFKKTEVEKRLLFTKLSSLIVYLIGIVLILWRLGVTGQNIAIVIGFMATGFALSIRDFVASYLAWLVLLNKRPFRIGDYIRVEGIEGIVRHVGTFYVMIDDTPETDTDFVRIPTTHFVQKPVQNFQQHPIPASVTVSLKDKKLSEKKRKELEQAVKTLSENAQVRIGSKDGAFFVRIDYTHTAKSKHSLADAMHEAVYDVLG